MADLDTRENKKQKLRGEHGYVVYETKHNLKRALQFLGVCFLFYFLGVGVFPEIYVLLHILSALLILPTAQFAAKYFTYRRYKPLEDSEYKALEEISPAFTLLGELPIVRQQLTYYVKCITVSTAGVVCLIDPLDDVQKTRKNNQETRLAIESILKPKGYTLPVEIINEYQTYFTYLKDTLKSKAQEKNSVLQEQIAGILILKAH